MNENCKHIILAGVKGVGKSYYGKKIAQDLNVPFLDVDRRIEAYYAENTGETITCKSLMQKGEHHFRHWESQVIQTIPSSPQVVIALGGGTLLDPVNQEILKSLGTIIVLDMEKALWKCNTQGTFPYGTLWDTAYEKRVNTFRNLPCIWLNVCGLHFYPMLREIAVDHGQ